MSTPGRVKPDSAAPESSIQPTRQLLDELDLLMQRMLALPVNQLEEELRAATAVPPVPPPPLPKEGPIYRRLAVEDLPETPENAPAGRDQDTGKLPSTLHGRRDFPPGPTLLLLSPTSPAAADLAREPDAEKEERARAGTVIREERPPRSQEEEWEQNLPAGPELMAAISQRSRAEQERAGLPGSRMGDRPNASLPEPVVAPWLRPLVWSNQLFDQWTTKLGRPGHWLRGDGGRALLGWAGLGLLTGALAWLLAGGFGWTW
jgi:hypothetical protein